MQQVGRIGAVVVGDGDDVAGSGGEADVAGARQADFTAEAPDRETAAATVEQRREAVIWILVDHDHFEGGRLLLGGEGAEERFKLGGPGHGADDQRETAHVTSSVSAAGRSAWPSF